MTGKKTVKVLRQIRGEKKVKIGGKIRQETRIMEMMDEVSNSEIGEKEYGTKSRNRKCV